MNIDPNALAEQGQQAFSAKKLDQAADFFSAAASGFEAANDPLKAAEMKNNLSVALLKMGKAQEAWDAVAETDKVFEAAGDIRRQGLAIGNQAAALEELGQISEAQAAFERSAALFAEAGESDLRSIVLQSIAMLKLKRGKLMEAGLSMIGSIDSAPHPTIMQNILRFLLRFIT